MQDVMMIITPLMKITNADDMKWYWRVFMPLSFILLVMVWFPLRIDIREVFLDTVFFGLITLACIGVAVHTLRRFRIRSILLVMVILLCAVLSLWQVIDLQVFHCGDGGCYFDSPFDYEYNGFFDGYAKFPNGGSGICVHTEERYIGTIIVAITIEIDRHARWGCG